MMNGDSVRALEDAIMRAVLVNAARAGRGGDTRLVHITPREEALLRRHGGSGTINPHTGLREYLQEGMGRDARGRDFGGSDRDSDDDRGGGRDRFESGPGGHGAGVAVGPTGTVGNAGISDRPDRDRGISPNPGGTGSSGNAPSGDMGEPASEDAGSVISRGVQAFANPPDPFGPPTRKSPGILGTALSAIPGFGLALGVTRALQAMGVPSEPDYSRTTGTRGSDNDRLSEPRRAPAAPREVASRHWSRPATMPNAPQHLGFDAQMTPLQMRSAIATSGTNTQGGAMMDPAVVQYYRNLALFDLLGQNNQLNPGAQPLAIERQYLSQLGAQPGETTESFLDALMGMG